jgi:DNA-directed RNA polymerase subunit RPC12/RpoP
MRTFKCYDCQHIWQLPHGEGGCGRDLTCPQCGSKNLHREDRDCGCRETAAPAGEAPGRGRHRHGRRWAD